nr:hypothetical protein [Demequina litorisediminis]
MTPIDYEAIARDAGLERVGARPPLGEYLAEMWRRRAFATSLAKFRIQATVAENRLGLAWIVLRPLLNAALYGTIFGIILPRSTRPGDVAFIPFLVVGVFIFEFFSKSFSDGAKAITGNASLVRSLNFPRMLLPVAQIIQQVIEPHSDARDHGHHRARVRATTHMVVAPRDPGHGVDGDVQPRHRAPGGPPDGAPARPHAGDPAHLAPVLLRLGHLLLAGGGPQGPAGLDAHGGATEPRARLHHHRP